MDAIKFLNQELSWDSLDKKLKDLTTSKQTKKAGDIFEIVVKYYLLTNPKYKSTLTNVWLLKEVPASVKLKLNLPNIDEGIDLIAETKAGHFWAIQAKYRSDPNETLTISGKGSLATFNNLAFGYCKNISHGLVLTTVSKPPKKIKLINHVGFETLESFLSLDDNNKEEWKSLLAASVGKIVKPKKLEPRPHQVEAIRKAVEYFKTNERGKMIMPCGTGKSLAAFWIAKEMEAKSILIAVPSLALLQQTLKVWTREFLINDINPDWLCVCSDDTVKENQDSFVSFTYDLGIEVTTDKNQIKKFLESKTKIIKVIFTTYQSGKVTAEGSNGFVFDLGIMDEAHKTVGHIDKPMALLLNEKNIKIKNRLFMTATERLFRFKKDEYMSMDNPQAYGDVIYELSFKNAISANPQIISDYKIITFGISEPEIEEIYKNNKFLQVKKDLKDITAREFATAIALRKAIKELNINNAISFHSTIKRAVNFKKQQKLITEIYPEYGSLNTFHVSGEMSASERSSQMRLFGEEKGLITNARCLTEGVDLPAIDCVCFTDPKKSRIDIVQAAGRALRLSPGKKYGYILIPIFIPVDQDPETTSKDNAFEEIVETVGALSTQDSRIAEYLREVKEGKVITKGSPIEGKIIENILTKIDPDKFNKAIQLKIWDKIAKVNKKSYQEAKEYAQSLNLKSTYYWHEHTRNKYFPLDIPKSPNSFYKKEFEGWSKFLGTNWILYEEAKKYAQSLNLKNYLEWVKHTKNINFPTNIPKAISRVYRKEFEGWSKFLASNWRVWRSYEDAKKYAQPLKLRTVASWFKHTKSKNFPHDIPKHPNITYLNKFEGWKVFLDKKWLSYEKAKKYIQFYKFKNVKSWVQYTKSVDFPLDIPKNPEKFYKKEFEGWSKFLGLEGRSRGGSTKSNRNFFLSYQDAKKFVRSLNMINMKEWFQYTKSINFPKNLPVFIFKYYEKEYEGSEEFFGFFENQRKIYRSYQEAKIYAQTLKLKNFDEWHKHTKNVNFPKDIPVFPYKFYKNEFEGMDVFLGVNKVKN